LIKIKQITEITHLLVVEKLREGDRAVDATAGNGNDTLFLAEKVGPAGWVHAFDIQEEALNNTLEKLSKKGLQNRVSLHLTGHEYLLQYVQEPISVIMYNLGYLPGSSREITTKCDTTLESIKQALKLLLPGGLVTIVLYPGHPEGAEEKKYLLPYFADLSTSDYTVAHYKLINQGHNPPELVVIQKNLFDKQ